MEPLVKLTWFNTATSQERLDCNHSKAHNVKAEWQGKAMRIGVWRTHCKGALSEHEPTFSEWGGGGGAWGRGCRQLPGRLSCQAAGTVGARTSSILGPWRIFDSWGRAGTILAQLWLQLLSTVYIVHIKSLCVHIMCTSATHLHGTPFAACLINSRGERRNGALADRLPRPHQIICLNEKLQIEFRSGIFEVDFRCMH